MKTIYIAGKVTGAPPIATAVKFANAEAHLARLGYHVLNPVTRIQSLQMSAEPWERIMKQCIRDLCTADSIYLLSDWRRSRGALLEREIAVALGLEVIHESEQVQALHTQALSNETNS